MSSDNRKPSSEGLQGGGFDSSRAELFDALGHPTRIRILRALSQRAMTFSELKKEVGIESSGHFTFHLGKLNLLLRVNAEGLYELTDDGREALHLAEIMSETSSTAAANATYNFLWRVDSACPNYISRFLEARVCIDQSQHLRLLPLGAGSFTRSWRFPLQFQAKCILRMT